MGTEKIERKIGTCGHRHGPSRRNVYAEGTVSLSDLFQSEVLNSEKWVWYVDYYTETPEAYNVSYLTSDPLLQWTNEAFNERDPHDPEGTSWASDDIAVWFRSEGEDASYRHVLSFHSEGIAHLLVLSPHDVTLDGEDRWAEYVEFGIRGAMGAFGEKRVFERLDSIEVTRI